MSTLFCRLKGSGIRIFRDPVFPAGSFRVIILK